MQSINTVRADFPFLTQTMNGHPLIYLDNAATTQKPWPVLQALRQYYTQENVNVHRGGYARAAATTAEYEGVRMQVARLINASSAREIVFTKGTTEALNWAAFGGAVSLKPQDEILVTVMEHHSNLVPWQILAARTGAVLRFVELTTAGTLDWVDFQRKLSTRTRVVAVSAASNVLGTVNPVAAIARTAHEVGALVVVDAAQAIGHMPVDVQEWGADFVAFSGHKMLGPTGIGVLWGQRAVLERMHPLEYGGEMISAVTRNETTFKEVPWCFEGGTQNIAGVIGLGKAIRYLEQQGIATIQAREQRLAARLAAGLRALPQVTVYGPVSGEQRNGVVAFNVGSLHAHDVATVLDAQGTAVRAGHHCAQVLMDHLGVPGTVRASVAFYNTTAEVDALVTQVERTEAFFKKHGMG
ncbi:aminotransferase class V-fold PLP-dependent enzyme [Ligilactobacillus sp. LYQ60]|uniref:aminotransferase class V-fold PLP-dependent enzyme n=1 Tax=unclassified Ligilactobacillus TaxID=2767920 RepID=UPI0038519C1E